MENISKLQAFWEKEYESSNTQFDIVKPDRWIEELERGGRIQSAILDSGCGPGRTSIYLAKKGYEVLGIDISHHAIQRAKEKAIFEKVLAKFQQADCTTFSGYENYFNTLIDIGCFHSLPGKKEQQQYAKVLGKAAKKGATLYLRAFSESNLQNTKHPKGVPAVPRSEIEEAFSERNGWRIVQLEEKEIDLLVAGNQTKKGHCWFAEIKK